MEFADNYSDGLLHINRRCKLRSGEMTRTVAKQYPNLVVHGSGYIEFAVTIEISYPQMSGIVVRRRVIGEGDAVWKRN